MLKETLKLSQFRLMPWTGRPSTISAMPHPTYLGHFRDGAVIKLEPLYSSSHVVVKVGEGDS